METDLDGAEDGATPTQPMPTYASKATLSIKPKHVKIDETKNMEEKKQIKISTYSRYTFQTGEFSQRSPWPND